MSPHSYRWKESFAWLRHFSEQNRDETQSGQGICPPSQCLKCHTLFTSLFKSKRRIRLILLTRSPWTAMLAPIKVDEIAQNWKTFLHAKNIQNWCKFLGIGTLCLYRCQNGSKKPLFFSHSTARWNHGSKWNPVMMKHNDPLYQPRYHLSGLIQRIWSYLATTKTCPTGYFLLAPIY